MASRSLDDLHPWVKAKAIAFLARCTKNEYPILIYETLRSSEEQDQKFKEGKSNAHGGDSPHQYGLAFDCIPLLRDGRPEWNSTSGLWDILYKLADECGLDPLGMKGGEYLPWDRGHFQEPGWRLVKDLCLKS